jgi:hypothetical protein
MPDIAQLAVLNGVSLPILPPTAMPILSEPTPTQAVGESTSSGETISPHDKPEKQFGVTPKRASVVPPHLRTSSVQVEPATPPKWMVEQAAEEAAAKSNELRVEVESKTSGVTEDDRRFSRDSMAKLGGVVVKKGPKKERPTGECLISIGILEV